MTERSSIFSDEALDDFEASLKVGPAAAEIDGTTRFPRRQPTAGLPSVDHQPTVDQPLTHRKPMTYRTGRNRVISIKTSTDFVERFYALAESRGLKVGEAFERAIEALERSEG